MVQFLMSFLYNNIDFGKDLSKHRVHTTRYQDLCM